MRIFVTALALTMGLTFAMSLPVSLPLAQGKHISLVSDAQAQQKEKKPVTKTTKKKKKGGNTVKAAPQPQAEPAE